MLWRVRDTQYDVENLDIYLFAIKNTREFFFITDGLKANTYFFLLSEL